MYYRYNLKALNEESKGRATPSVANTNLKQTIWLHRTLKANTLEESWFFILGKRHMKANIYAK